MNPPDYSSENHPIPVAHFQKSTLDFIGATPPKNDGLEKFHISNVKNENPEFSLSSEEIDLIREFSDILRQTEEIEKDFEKFLPKYL